MESAKLDLLEKSLIDLKKIDVTKKVKSLKRIKEQLNALKHQFEFLNKYFSDVAIIKTKKLINNYLKNKKLSASEGLSQFKTKDIGSIGSDEWKDNKFLAEKQVMSQYINILILILINNQFIKPVI